MKQLLRDVKFEVEQHINEGKT